VVFRSHDVSGDCRVLVEAAKCFAIVSYRGVVESFRQVPEIGTNQAVSVKAWDHYAAVAAIGVAYHAVPLGFSMPTLNDYRRAIVDAAVEWDPDAPDSLNAFFEVTHSTRPLFGEDYSTAVGVYVLGGVLSAAAKRGPTHHELEAARWVGPLLVNGFSSWWSEQGMSTAIQRD